jgi:hypothetical protein
MSERMFAEAADGAVDETGARSGNSHEKSTAWPLNVEKKWDISSTGCGQGCAPSLRPFARAGRTQRRGIGKAGLAALVLVLPTHPA